MWVHFHWIVSDGFYVDDDNGFVNMYFMMMTSFEDWVWLHQCNVNRSYVDDDAGFLMKYFMMMMMMRMMMMMMMLMMMRMMMIMMIMPFEDWVWLDQCNVNRGKHTIRPALHCAGDTQLVQLVH